MKNRKYLPLTVRDSKFSLQAGEIRCFRDGRLLTLAWKAESKRKPLIMLSSCGSGRPMTVRTRRETVSKPAVVNAYNHNMNGVNVADQFTVFYSFVRRTRKWWRKLFFYLLEVTVVNSFLLYRQTVHQPKNHLAYRRMIVEQAATIFIQQAPPRPGPGAPRRQPTNSVPQRLDKKQHFIGKSLKDRDCVVCSCREKNKRHRTIYYCNTCTNHPYLCPDVCFTRYHTLINYKL